MSPKPRQNTAWGESPLLPEGAVWLNGTAEEKLDRLAIRELAESWPCHRDAQRWPLYRNMFTDDAYIFTTWSGGCSIDDFIDVSKKGFANGERITHRAHGCTVGVKGDRGIALLKTSIYQYFDNWPAADGNGTVEVEVDCSNQFMFLVEKIAGEWKCAYYKVFYEHCSLNPNRPDRLPAIDEAKLATYPKGYDYLGYAQEELLGHRVLRDLPGAKGEQADLMYDAMQLWTASADRSEIDAVLSIERK